MSKGICSDPEPGPIAHASASDWREQGLLELEPELQMDEQRMVVRVQVMQRMDRTEPRWLKQLKPEPKRPKLEQKWPKWGFP
jgi:hypothetical protein